MSNIKPCGHPVWDKITEKIDPIINCNIRIYQCSECGETRMEQDRLGQCDHKNWEFKREEPRKNCRGETFMRKVFWCPDCGAEFSL